MAGALVHFELPAKDTVRAREFWSGLFSWSFSDPGMPGVEYWMTRTGDEQGGAVMPADGQSGVVVYFGTDDIGDSITRTRALGGSAEDAYPVPGVGWIARCVDTEGNAFSLFQGDESAGG